MTENDVRYPAFAVAAPGLEEVVAAELRALGMAAVAEPGGAAWDATAEQLYTANLESRAASRIVVRIAEFRARTFFELQRHAERIEWERFAGPGRAIQLRVTCRKSKLYHEGAVEQRLREAIQTRTGATPVTPDDEFAEGDDAQLFVIRFVRDRCTVSADSSGALLHRRGYRQEVGKAPLRETIAASMLLTLGWDGSEQLLDPMCGSGTIPIEAALLARRIAPGIACEGKAREFAFRHWREHDEALWNRLVEHARERILPAAPAPILASDRDEGAVQVARRNAERAGVAADIRFGVAALSSVQLPPSEGVVVVNPPYGVRVGDRGPLRDLYAAFGRLLRDRMAGWRIVLLSADPALEAQLGLPLEELLATRNGGVPVRLVSGAVPF